MGFCSSQRLLYTVERSSPQTPKKHVFANSPLDAKSRGRLMERAPPDRSLTRWRGQVSSVATLLQSPLGSLAPSGRSGHKQLALLGVARLPRRLRRLAPHSVPSLEAGTLSPPGPQSVRHYILPDYTAKCAATHPCATPGECADHSPASTCPWTPRVCGTTSRSCTRESVRHYIRNATHRRCARLIPKDFHKAERSLRHPKDVRRTISDLQLPLEPQLVCAPLLPKARRDSVLLSRQLRDSLRVRQVQAQERDRQARRQAHALAQPNSHSRKAPAQPHLNSPPAQPVTPVQAVLRPL